MPTSNIVKEKILLHLESLIPETEDTEELMLASKAVMDLDNIKDIDDTPPDWDQILTRLSALELSVDVIDGEVKQQGDTLDAHRVDSDNPHNTGAAQTGSYDKKQSDELFSRSNHDHDLTYSKLDHSHEDLVPKATKINGRSLVRDVELNKSDIGLTLVNNWGASSDITNASSESYATSNAVHQLYELISNGSLALSEVITLVDELRGNMPDYKHFTSSTDEAIKVINKRIDVVTDSVNSIKAGMFKIDRKVTKAVKNLNDLLLRLNNSTTDI